MGTYTSRVREILRDYIEEESTLETMGRIHQKFTGERKDFGQWEEVEIEYLKKDWDEDKIREFALLSKETIESGVEEIAESYFDILDTELEAGDIESKLSNNEITEQKDSGFRFNRTDSGMITGVYFYKTKDVDISSSGNIDRLTTEKSIPFRIIPEKNLLVVETTYSPLVQKLGGVFNNKLDIQVQVCGDITVLPDQAKQRVSSFLDSFEREIPRSDWE